MDFKSCQGNVRDFTKSQESVGKKSCQGKMAKNGLLLVAYLRPYGYLVAFMLSPLSVFIAPYDAAQK